MKRGLSGTQFCASWSSCSGRGLLTFPVSHGCRERREQGALADLQVRELEELRKKEQERVQERAKYAAEMQQLLRVSVGHNLRRN